LVHWRIIYFTFTRYGFGQLFPTGCWDEFVIPKEAVDVGVSASSLSLQTFITHIFPRSFAEAMANNEILQILVFQYFLVLHWLMFNINLNRHW
jgi:Na+/H+-dicarboxylate symporter